MPNYAESDSDSDLAVGDYHTTDVLLGYASSEPTDEAISAIGGQPTWLDPASPPSAALARCNVCHDLMPQLLQLHADLPNDFPTHQRRLHVFACRRRTCTRKLGSVRALRTSCASTDEASAPATASSPPTKAQPPPAQPQTKPEPPRNIGGSIFGGKKLFGAPPPAPAPAAAAAAPGIAPGDDLPATFANKARITSASPPSSSYNLHHPASASSSPAPPFVAWPSLSDLPRPYTFSYLDADFEEVDPDDENAPLPNSAALKIEASAEEAGGSGSSGNDVNDAALAESNLDVTFQRFADRLAQNPEQVLRYEFKGMPLLYSKRDATGRLFSGGGGAAAGQPNPKVSTTAGSGVSTGMPPCERCAGPRVFEVQLVPHAILELEMEREDEDGDKMDVDAAGATRTNKKQTAAASGVAGGLAGGGGGVGAAVSPLEEGMEWATIIVGVCARDCTGAAGESIHVEEWAGVQWEEQQ